MAIGTCTLRLRSALLILLTCFFDQLSKGFVVGLFPVGYQQPVIPGLFDVVHWTNTGAAWGMFQGYPWVLALFSGAVLVLFWIFLDRITEGRPVAVLAAGLILGGILGNLIDRALRGAVIDFLFFHVREFQWPAFNLADSAICVGVFLYMIAAFVHRDHGKSVPIGQS